MIVDLPVPSLLGGVSQQPPASRQPNQLEDAENVLAHVVNGLGKRKGTRHVARLFAGDAAIDHVHYVNRDVDERYVFLLGERRLRIFDDEGAEYPIYNPSGALVARAGKPIPYLDPRTYSGVTPLTSTEDFVISAGNWLTVAANSTTSYVSGVGPFGFGRFQSATSTSADTVAKVGNGAAATISDIYEAAGVFGSVNVVAVYAKKDVAAINDFELGLIDTTATIDHTARFDISAGGVFTVGAVSGAPVEAFVEDVGDGWYLCWMRVTAYPSSPPAGYSTIGNSRRYRIRFHTNAATPASKNLLLYGARVWAGISEPADYLYDRSTLYRALTIVDTTLLLNRQTTPAMTAAKTAVLDETLFVWVRSGAYNSTYSVTVEYSTLGLDNSVTFSVNSGSSGLTARTDEDIAEDLRAAIDAHADLAATRNGSVIRIVHASPNVSPPSGINNVSTSDSNGDQSLVAIGRDADFFAYVRRFTDLPLICDDGFVVKVTGDPENEIDDYWVKFTARTTISGDTLVAGFWEETLQPDPTIVSTSSGVSYAFDDATMPQQVVRRQDDSIGTITDEPYAIYFEVGPVDWADRLVGDDSSNPEPNFVGSPIRDLFLFRGRLGFLSGDAVNLSEVNEPFQFWRSTVISLPDTDPIEVSSGARESLDLISAAVGVDTCLVFSARQQFELLGDPTLTPASAQLALTRSFDGMAAVAPVPTARGTQFVRQVGAFSGLLETTRLGDSVNFRVEELTAQAPRFIEGSVELLAHSALVELSVAVATDPATLYVHQSFFDESENRLQSALFRWTLGGDAAVRGVGFFDADLYLVVERDEGWFLEAVDCSTETLESSGRPSVLLDRRVTEAQLTSRAYDGGNDETTLTLPFNIPDDVTIQVVDATSGLLVPVRSQTTTTVVVGDDLSASSLYVGESYEMAAELSEPVLRDQGPRGLNPRLGRPLDLHRLHLYLADTAFVRVEVERDLRGSTFEEFSAAGLGTGLLLEGTLNRYTGSASFAVISPAVEAAVTVRNATPFPSFIQAARWEALFNPRGAPAG